jgi:hypothetical protein
MDTNQESVRKLSRVAFWGGHKISPVRHKYMLTPTDFSSPLLNENLPGQAAACTFDNRFSSTGWAVPQSFRYITFRLQASYLSATSHTGRKSCRVKSLYMKRLRSIRAPGHPPCWANIFVAALETKIVT